MVSFYPRLVNGIIQLKGSVCLDPKVIPLSGTHCITLKNQWFPLILQFLMILIIKSLTCWNGLWIWRKCCRFRIGHRSRWSRWFFLANPNRTFEISTMLDLTFIENARNLAFGIVGLEINNALKQKKNLWYNYIKVDVQLWIEKMTVILIGWESRWTGKYKQAGRPTTVGAA
jgi:hypothetical protein